MDSRNAMPPTATVLIGTYNRARTLGETLDSLARMIVPPGVSWDVVVVDNNSTDDTATIVRERLKRGGADLERRLREAYQGVTDAWSLGITRIPAVVVDGRYVVYGEADVERALARIEAYRRTSQ